MAPSVVRSEARQPSVCPEEMELSSLVAPLGKLLAEVEAPAAKKTELVDCWEVKVKVQIKIMEPVDYREVTVHVETARAGFEALYLASTHFAGAPLRQTNLAFSSPAAAAAAAASQRKKSHCLPPSNLKHPAAAKRLRPVALLLVADPLVACKLCLVEVADLTAAACWKLPGSLAVEEPHAELVDHDRHHTAGEKAVCQIHWRQFRRARTAAILGIPELCPSTCQTTAPALDCTHTYALRKANLLFV